MIAVYIVLGIATIALIIYGLACFCKHVETRYYYRVFDRTNIVVLCISCVVSTFLLFACGNDIYDGPNRFTTDMWNPYVIGATWILFNLGVFGFVFIRNWIKSSLICSILETLLQFIAAIAVLITILIIITAIVGFLHGSRRGDADNRNLVQQKR